ncbi:MAG: hypothetical protein IT323_21005 [Anaerolineae bacterium]|nr:hypothetical protein [Anaerolineae bacterium]
MVKLKQAIPKKKMPLPGGSGPSKPPTPKRPDTKPRKAPSVGGGVARPTPASMPGPGRPPDVAPRVTDKGRDVGTDEPFTLSLADKRAMQDLLAKPRNEELQYLVDPEAQRVLRYVRRMPGIVDAALRIAKSPKAAFEFLLADGIALADEVIARLLAAEGIDLTPWQPQPDPCSSEEWCSAPVVYVKLELERELTWGELAARLGIPVEVLLLYNGAMSGPIPPGGTVALPIPGLRLVWAYFNPMTSETEQPMYIGSTPGTRSLLPYMFPLSVPVLESMWQGLTLLEMEIEFALALTAEKFKDAPFDNVLSFDETVAWITQNTQNITTISARFDVDPALVAGILASELLYDYSQMDRLMDSLGIGEGSGYASAHDTTLIPAIRHLEKLYGMDIPWLRDALAPAIKRSDEDPREFEFVTDPTSYTLTPTGAIAAAAIVARYYTDHYVDFDLSIERHSPAHLPEDDLDEIAPNEASQRRHRLSETDMAVIFGAYRAGVGGVAPNFGSGGFETVDEFRSAAQDLGANALLALPLMRYFREVFR